MHAGIGTSGASRRPRARGYPFRGCGRLSRGPQRSRIDRRWRTCAHPGPTYAPTQSNVPQQVRRTSRRWVAASMGIAAALLLLAVGYWLLMDRKSGVSMPMPPPIIRKRLSSNNRGNGSSIRRRLRLWPSDKEFRDQRLQHWQPQNFSLRVRNCVCWAATFSCTSCMPTARRNSPCI